MKWDFSKRFGFLIRDIDRHYGEQFDRLARERIGLSRAQCRLLGELAMHGDDQPLSQRELAQRMDISAMSVGAMCDRLVAAGWISRSVCLTDRRINEVRLAPRAVQALNDTLKIGDVLSAQVLAVLNASERAELLRLLDKVRARQLRMTAASGNAAEAP